MSSQTSINSSVLDDLIIGRVEPHIYAFSTETVPNYLKVGDAYRPLEIRINEWRKHFPNLKKQFVDVAKVDDETFYRDHAIHYFLEKELKKTRLERNIIKNLPYFSNEFFKNATSYDIQEAIEDIRNSFLDNKNKYQFYKFDSSRVPITYTYARTENYEPRPNQQTTIDKFKYAIKKGRTNLLMYAVMRFGKSFTSMCCATEMNANIVVIVTAKADVKEEWKRTVESHIRFADYEFVDSYTLLQSDTIIKNKIRKGAKVVVFLTLQDLQGPNLKPKHREVFINKLDLLIIDETHFGARANEYGKVLQEVGIKGRQLKNEFKGNDETIDDLENCTKILKPKVRLHLSGTPYRILMGSEFTDEDIVAFYQFTDIANDQEKWDKENLNKDDVREWDNPYYGFPQMIRFAFNPNESSRRKMEELKKNGTTYAFSELFKPKSITKDSKHQNHRKFEHQEEILDLLEVIDGSKSDDNLLGFLDYEKIKKGNMCRHMVCVLPYRASCDAIEYLIKSNRKKFKNLNKYEIINIAGVENERLYTYTQSVKEKIKKCEANNKKTLTLTVNRMLTGSTVEEWDTMLYLKDTVSPQEYDQAIFRLQNQFVVKYSEPYGDVIKYNMKPQTLLVDFDPNRMFSMQEQKSQIYNVNTNANGNSELEERIKRELEISPIVVLNKDRLVQVTPSDILDAVRKYSSERSVFDEATTIPVDISLIDIYDIRTEIEKQGKIGSKQGLEIKPNEGDGDDIDVTTGEDIDTTQPSSGSEESKTEIEEDDWKSKFAMFYAKILFFAFLTDSRVKSLSEIIAQIDVGADNKRIANSLDLKMSILKLLNKHIYPFTLSKLDYKIHNINSLANDDTLKPIDRASNAMKRFSRLSVSEIVTPENVTNQIMNILPSKDITNKTKILDIASKQGEFVYAVYKKYGKEIAKNFYSIPTSKIAYEFTRKVYQLLELDIKHIESKYTSYDLIKENQNVKKNKIKIRDTYMKFNVIVGNPPYQQLEGGGNENTALPIYNHFVDLAKKLNPNYMSLIMPTRWYAGGRGLDDFRNQMLNDTHISELHDFLKPELIFQNINIRGGICYILWEKDYDNNKDLTKVYTYNDDFKPSMKRRSLRTKNSDILIRHGIGVSVIEKVSKVPKFESLANHVSAAKAFGFRTFFIKDTRFRRSSKGLKNPVICYGRADTLGYVDKSEIISHEDWIDVWKVYVPESNNIGTELSDDNQNSFVGEPGTICTETYLVVGAELSLNKLSSKNLSIYLRTKFARFLHSLAKISQHGTSKTYQFIPVQNFSSTSDINWKKSIKEIDYQLYKKYKLTKEEIEFIEKMIKPMK
jgi:hypothetical protein